MSRSQGTLRRGLGAWPAIQAKKEIARCYRDAVSPRSQCQSRSHAICDSARLSSGWPETGPPFLFVGLASNRAPLISSKTYSGRGNAVRNVGCGVNVNVAECAHSFHAVCRQRRVTFKSPVRIPTAYYAVELLCDLSTPPCVPLERTMKRTKTYKKKPRSMRASAKSKRKAATGAMAFGFHEGSRSEVLADYLFSAWGTVTPARRQSDYGLDLYCTLTERLGPRARVQEYFSVQVKSSAGALWAFNDPASVKWLIDHPLPLFLSTVDKTKGIVRVYHTIPRFQIWALGQLPKKVVLKPGDGVVGTLDPCAHPPRCSLSAPIIQVSLPDLADDQRMKRLRKVLAFWASLDRENCELVRGGLLRFRKPDRYETNKVPTTNSQFDLAYVDDRVLKKGLFRLAEAIECIGGQLAHPNRNRRVFALHAAVLLDRIQQEFPDVFAGNPWWKLRVPGLLKQYVVRPLNEIHGKASYLYFGLDEVEAAFAKVPLVKKYLNDGRPEGEGD
jgi:hypothetical protein